MDLSNIESARVVLDDILVSATEAEGTRERAWAQFFPPRALEWNCVELPLANLPDGLNGLRIVHLTDFHLRKVWPAGLDPLLARVQRDPPDLVLITGDFVDNKRNHRPAMPNVRRLVDGLVARIGCFAIHGNHDNYNVGRELKDSKFTFLDGARHVVEAAGGKIELIGLPGKRRDELTAEVRARFPARESGVPRIVLSHYPDHLKRMPELNADLFLAGHTHGGQVCLPNGTPILRHDSLPRRLTKGTHRIGSTWLVVSRGVGYTTLPVRIFCPPEVIEIRCVKAPARVFARALPRRPG